MSVEFVFLGGDGKFVLLGGEKVDGNIQGAGIEIWVFNLSCSSGDITVFVCKWAFTVGVQHVVAYKFTLFALIFYRNLLFYQSVTEL